MDEYELIRVISNVISNNLYKDKEVLTLLSSNSLLKLTVLEDITTGDVNGCLQYGDNIFSFRSTASQNECCVVLANLESKEMRVFTGNQNNEGDIVFEETQFDFFTPNEVVDLDKDGRRWEGEVIGEKKPHGYGLFYDENGDVESECFVFDGMKVCYAKEYYSEINLLKYEGTHAIGCRCGDGLSFDRAGDSDYDGVWYCNHPVGDLGNPNNPVLPFLHNHLRTLSLSENDLNDNACNRFILLGCLINLTSLQIDDNGLPHVHHFELNGLPNLKEVMIGNGCVSMSETPVHLTITHCMSLERIGIGQSSFINTSHVIMKGKMIIE